MKLPFLAKEYAIEALNVDDAEKLTAIHEEDFVRPWSPNEFESLLEQDTVFGFAAWRVGHRRGDPAGFVLARLAAGEGEILTIAVSRAHRRQGLGRDLMEAVLRELHAERAEALFLEVDETNNAAIAMYKRLGFTEIARRPGYYEHGADKRRTDALVMRRDPK
ncbi:ribosomal protein S18-alanine N-acetyltransferase [Aquamicrobium zhengzhouense]|uniref:Ribosomal protein S18-alanine N-acetyltransferase n=1 Tax=Aquamicrobium zhengzhouense TaxID=2781738 RepID=A0ABS0SEA3_9HYPH|nr:ribosomal protein S18-alanine N-acetyltransferase [Aquamicrobium zhengzhouense]MBI1620980.1 ribosomal protein S18-alanine N-acetyltransferase [Aquamicrobium zhengzhouense]